MDPTATRILGRSGVAVTQLGLGVPRTASSSTRCPSGRLWTRCRQPGTRHPLLRHGALVWPRPLGAAHGRRAARQAARRVHPLDQDRPLAQGPGPGLRGPPWAVAEHARSRWSSTTPTTASCGPTSRASCAWACPVRPGGHPRPRPHVPRRRRQVRGLFGQLATSGWRAVTELRAHGLIRGIGAGINELGHHPALPRDRRPGLLPHRHALHAPATRRSSTPSSRPASSAASASSSARPTSRASWPPGHERRERRLRAGVRRRSGRRGGASRRSASATACRSRRRRCSSRWAIPSVASVIPGARSAGAGPAQRRGLPARHPGRPVGRAQARGPAARGRRRCRVSRWPPARLVSKHDRST